MGGMARKEMKLPIGIEFFRDIRTKGFYYVDKTEFIRDLLHTWGSVNPFTRPRRFGKSLNMDMLKTFFEIGTDASSLFKGWKYPMKKNYATNIWGNIRLFSST